MFYLQVWSSANLVLQFQFLTDLAPPTIWWINLKQISAFTLAATGKKEVVLLLCLSGFSKFLHIFNIVCQQVHNTFSQ